MKLIVTRYLSAALVSALLAAPAAAKKKRDDYRFAFSDINIAKTPSAAEFPQAGTVTLLEEGKITYDEDGFIFTRHVVRKLISDRGLEYADVKIPYIKDYSDVIDIQARTITPEGSVIPMSQDKVFDITDFPDFILYSDYRAKKFTLPRAQVGAVIEYIFVQRLKTISIPPWHFQGHDPVVLSRFILEVPAAIKYKILKRQGDNNVTISDDVRTGNDGSIIATYTARDIPAIEDEPLMPPIDDVVASVQFVPVMITWRWWAYPLMGSSWKAIGQWYTDICEDKQRPGPRLKLQTDLLTAVALTPCQKSKAICEYIRDYFRYVAIYLEDGSYVPHAVDEVLQNQYGDCKDIALLTVAMLNYSGIKARVGLLKTANDGTLNKTLCSYAQFNHAVVCIQASVFKDSPYETKVSLGPSTYTEEDDWLVFDPTVRWCPFGQLPWADRGVDVLVVNGSMSDFITTSTGKAGDNQFLCQEQAVLDSQGLRGVISCRATGAVAIDYRYRYLAQGPAELAEKIKMKLAALRPEITVDSVNHANLANLDSTMATTVFYSIRSAVPNGVMGYSAYDDLDNISPFVKDKRLHPVNFPYPFRTCHAYQFSCELPGQRIKPFRDSVQIDNSPVSSYMEQWFCDGRSLNASRTFTMDMVYHGPGSYGQLQEIFGKAAGFRAKRFLLEPLTTNQPKNANTRNRRTKQ